MYRATQAALPERRARALRLATPGIPPKERFMPDKPFVTDVKKIRERARKHIEEGAVTENYGADKETVLKLLNDSLATEIVCTLRYRRHYFMAKGLTSAGVAEEFMEHAKEEQEHADQFAERIVQLGGEPDFNPEGLTSRSHAEYVEGESLIDMIREDLVAERIAIESYRDIINYLGEGDPTTRKLFEDVLAVEEEHADDMLSLIENVGRQQGGAA
jgi:bacterioferritin